MLKGTFKEGNNILVDFKNGKVIFKNKVKRKRKKAEVHDKSTHDKSTKEKIESLS